MVLYSLFNEPVISVLFYNKSRNHFWSGVSEPDLILLSEIVSTWHFRCKKFAVKVDENVDIVILVTTIVDSC